MDGTNLSGFSALPTGYRWDNGSFSYFQENSHFGHGIRISMTPSLNSAGLVMISFRDYSTHGKTGLEDPQKLVDMDIRYVARGPTSAAWIQRRATLRQGPTRTAPVSSLGYYDCQGNCLSDADGDGICDEFEMLGCDDVSACNYNDTATDNDGSCTYVDGVCETCEDGVIVDNDADDGYVCNDDEIIGCQEVEACNYAPAATSPAPATTRLISMESTTSTATAIASTISMAMACARTRLWDVRRWMPVTMTPPQPMPLPTFKLDFRQELYDSAATV